MVTRALGHSSVDREEEGGALGSLSSKQRAGRS